MAPPKVTLYVDIVSPFAYIAFHVLKVSLVARSLGSLPDSNLGNFNPEQAITWTLDTS